MKFSEREGIIKPKVGLQIDSIDDALRNCLWNTIYLNYIEPYCYVPYMDDILFSFLKLFWHSYLKKPADVVDKHDYEGTIQALRTYFLKCPWYEVYDIVEFFANNFRDPSRDTDFIKCSNAVLETELSGYRFVGKIISPITSKNEIVEIEEAMSSPIKSVNIHIENALKLMADKESPDYRNSIKESISAVEAICKLIVNNSNATLGQALNIIEKDGKITLHPDLKEAFANLYHYTSDADGIRHALKDEKVNADFDEAKFMLVACSAFVNYIISKAAKASIKI
jgi:hypothetical protein